MEYTLMTYHITLTDPMNGTRDREPITFILPEKLQEPLWWAITDEDARILCQRLEQESSASRTAFIATVSFSGTLKMRLDRPLTAAEVSEIAGIHRLPGRERTVLSVSPAASIWKCVGNRPGRRCIQVGAAPFSRAGQRRAASFRK
jgi:hypothetical protein